MKNYIAITAKFQGPTGHYGSRLVLNLPRWDNKRLSRGWQHHITGLEKQAREVLEDAGIEVLGFAEAVEGCLVLVDFAYAESVRALFGVK